MPDGWGKLPPEIAAERPDALPAAAQGIILRASEGEAYAGCIGAERVWCVSPLHVSEDYLGLGVPALLAERLAAHNAEGLREMLVTTSPHVERLVYKLGFRPLEGTLWRRER